MTDTINETIRSLVAAGRTSDQIAEIVCMSRYHVQKRVREEKLGEWRGNRRREMPADFAEHAAREGIGALRLRYGRDTPTINQWIAESGVVRPALKGGKVARPVPDDFAAMSDRHSNSELMAHYGCGSEMLYRWRKESGAQKRDKMRIPDDFAEVWKDKSVLKLAAHYNRNHSTISAWIKRLGLTRPRGVKITKPIKAAPAPKPQTVPFERKAPPKRFVKPDAYRTTAVDHLQRDMSPAGQAADTLRRDRWTVFRCDDRGRANPAGKLWLCGRVICTDAELIARAERAARRIA